MGLINTGDQTSHFQENGDGSASLPPFAIKDLRAAIPSHCFQRSLWISSRYLFVDLSLIAIIFCLGTMIPSLPLFWMQCLAWPLYWYVQGAVMTGVWVIAHECGHQGFSDYKWVNNTVGLILHSLLLVPYHSWRISHSMHHKGTNHIERDQVFVPTTRSFLKLNKNEEVMEISPLGNLFWIAIMLTFGWPCYLIYNASGQQYAQFTSHFSHKSPIFKRHQQLDVILSDVGLLLVICLFYWICQTYGLVFFIQYYGIPYLWVNLWLVTITYLQHTHEEVPHYRGEEWNFIQGALATVDRNYGFLNQVFHHIGDTHVAHHLFSTMPHYHAEEATQYLKKALGKYYKHDGSPIFKSLYQTFQHCRFVEDEGNILYWNSPSCKKE